VHGVIFSLWIVLLLVQVGLVAAGEYQTAPDARDCGLRPGRVDGDRRRADCDRHATAQS
jgi:hypothetical protein